MGKTVRCCVIGDGTVGKTCLLVRYKDSTYNDNYIPTIFDSYAISVPVNGELIEFCLKDTAGNENYDTMRVQLCNDTDVYIMCFAIDNLTSFQNIQDKWYKEIKELAPSSKMVLVGTKNDLIHRDISKGQGERLAKSLGLPYVECSAKFGTNVSDVFNEALKLVLLGRKKMCILL